MILATVTILERECPADAYDTENGGGMPDDVEAVEVDCIGIDADDLTLATEYLGGCSLDDLIQGVLDDAGLSQWDGGRTAYDPDGSHMALDGTITERFARIDRA